MASLVAISRLGPSINPLTLWGRAPTQRSIITAAMSKAAAEATDRSHASPFGASRRVVQRFLSRPQSEGDGAVVRRSIGRPELKQLDPFLMLDEFTVSAPAGFPDHPHRGFETVTYMLHGTFTHQDFKGHKGTIGAGDLQWMTAGRGIVHSEMPVGEGVQHGLQLWVNLAAKHKMTEPAYQELRSEDVSSAEANGVAVRVIAGESLGVRSPVYTRTPTMFLDFTLQPGATVDQAVPEGWNSFLYVLEGEGVFGEWAADPVGAHHALVLGGGDGVSIWNRGHKALRFVLLGGKPLGEPVVQYGPFVMNTAEEIRQAFDDYRHCRNGFENATSWKSN